MASLFGHAAVALTASRVFPAEKRSWRLPFWSAVCAILPDADVIMFFFGVSYHSQWGHRGFSHSLAFALALGFAVACLAFRNETKTRRGLLKYWLFFSVVTSTHSVLDALTNGGLGVAAFWPVDNSRYFFPYRPIQVSPIGIAEFFSPAGLAVVQSEFFWILLPCLAVALFHFAWKR